MAFYGAWPEYVPAALRRRRAAKQVAALQRKGKALNPAVVEGRGRSIARTFWGDAWCKNLEAYSDYSNRLPRGRTYLRNGSVIDLQVAAGRVNALVQGSSLYRISIKIRPIATPRWKGIVRGCSGHIASLVELLRGGVSEHVMKIVTERDAGLFPAPAEISLECSCPDWATMCKHVAASLYGVGVRLDERPELLFTLRGVDAAELVRDAAGGDGLGGSALPRGKVLDAGDLSAVFGVEIDESVAPIVRRSARGRGVWKVASGSGESAAEGTPRTPGTRRSRKEGRATSSHGRTSSGVTELIAQLRKFIHDRPGLRMEQISRELSTTTMALVLPMKKLLALKAVVKRGHKRATRYYPG